MVFSRASILTLVLCTAAAAVVRADDRPNVLWIVAEDQSRHYGCYGEELVDTPRVDRLAQEGVRFTNAFVTAPVCSTCRSALVTGMYQTSIGAHHHRSGRGEQKIRLPEHVKLIPQLMQEAGFFTSLGAIGHVTGKGRKGKLGKSDYNFEWNPSVYDGGDWSQRKQGQPFFAQVMIGGGKSRSAARNNKQIPHVAVSKVELPPYYPNHPAIREDWAAYLDTFTLMDRQLGQILDRLESENELDKTVIFFLTDHGVSHARGKQYCYDEGMMVPLIVRAPGRVAAGKLRTDLAAHIDIAASTLYFANVEIPDYMQSRPLFGPAAKPREFGVSARDRCDETYDRIRAVRTKKYKYIRNGFPTRPHLQPCVYKDQKEIYKALRGWRADGKLNELQQRLLFSPRRAAEELYDLEKDPWETNNLAQSPDHANQLKHLRETLDHWIAETNDRGQRVEALARYESD
ncbi:MAG: sulfatase, partial [Pirellulaceae bacterium]|nr:sulfatase [Pirellulaceae bacterium]